VQMQTSTRLTEYAQRNEVFTVTARLKLYDFNRFTFITVSLGVVNDWLRKEEKVTRGGMRQ